MAVYMRVNGGTTRWREGDSSHGLTKDNMMVNILKTRNKVTVNSLGLMVENMKANGKMVNNMEMVHILEEIKLPNRILG